MSQKRQEDLARLQARYVSKEASLKVLNRKMSELFVVDENASSEILQHALHKHFGPTLIRLRVRTGLNQQELTARLEDLVGGSEDKIAALGSLMLHEGLERIITGEMEHQLAQAVSSVQSELINRLSTDFRERKDSAANENQRKLPQLAEFKREAEILSKELAELSLQISELSPKSFSGQALSAAWQSLGLELGLNAGSDKSAAKELLFSQLFGSLGPELDSFGVLDELVVERTQEVLLLIQLGRASSTSRARNACSGCGQMESNCNCSVINRFEGTLSRVFGLTNDEWNSLVSRYWPNLYPHFYLSPQRGIEELVDSIPASLIDQTAVVSEILQRMILGDRMNRFWFEEAVLLANSSGSERVQVNRWLKTNFNESLPSFVARVALMFPGLMSDEDLTVGWLLGLTSGGTNFPNELLVLRP